MELPDFFNYNEENTDNGYETIQDFFISWTLRCAVNNNGKYCKLNEYSKKILLYLVFGEEIPSAEIKILSVETKRQWKQIDLLAKINLEINNEKKYYILNIENKWYTPIRNGQLKKSLLYVENQYDDRKYNLINLILIPDSEKIKEIKKSIPNNLKDKIKIIIVENIKDKIDMRENTGNYLFDEYWFKLY